VQEGFPAAALALHNEHPVDHAGKAEAALDPFQGVRPGRLAGVVDAHHGGAELRSEEQLASVRDETDKLMRAKARIEREEQKNRQKADS
jgi:hypothetical protein